ncbi:replication initiation protein (plasmid) [Cobetia sp. UIB-001]|uniref:replication initiation protein n=1 Tax=Cobetia sp. UIB-001 TaxID=2717697 RepID=UPI0038511D9A
MNAPKIYKSNALVQASYRMSMMEQRIMLACTSQVRRDQPITDEVMYSVYAKDLAEVTGSTSKSAYEQLSKAALKLKRREVWLTERPNGDGVHPETLVTGWVQTIRYKKNEGRVDIRFNKDILPYLTQITEQFTYYSLKDVAGMTSIYAVRLFELLAQWRNVGIREINVAWLRDILQMEGKYASIKDFKKWVIDPSVDQINKHSPMQVTWEQKKTGRRITHFIFRFNFEEKTKDENKVKKRGLQTTKPHREDNTTMFGIPNNVIEKYAQPGDSWQDAAIRALDSIKKNKD